MLTIGVAPPSLSLRRRLTEVCVNSDYNVLSGRRIVTTRRGVSAREVALEYVRSMGCHRDEIIYYGVDGVCWRGAIYRAELVEPDAQSA